MGRTGKFPHGHPNGGLRVSRRPLEFWGPLIVLLSLGALAVASPWGLLAWDEYDALLDQRLAEKRTLEAEMAALQNRVNLLDPQAADDDLVDELVRRNLGVQHSDEVIVTIEGR